MLNQLLLVCATQAIQATISTLWYYPYSKWVGVNGNYNETGSVWKPKATTETMEDSFCKIWHELIEKINQLFSITYNMYIVWLHTQVSSKGCIRPIVKLCFCTCTGLRRCRNKLPLGKIWLETCIGCGWYSHGWWHSTEYLHENNMLSTKVHSMVHNLWQK